MRKASAPVVFLVGLLAVAAVAGLTYVVGAALDIGDEGVEAGATGPTAPGGGSAGAPLQDDQVEVRGVATGVTVEGATIDVVPTPFLVDGGPGRGATLEDVEVDGELTTVVWDGGRAFDLQATGLGVVPLQANVFASPGGISVGFIDGVVNTFVPGSYGLQTPVAIGSSGLARPQDSVAFEANDESTISFRGGAVVVIAQRELTFEATGRVVLEGQLQVRTADTPEPIAQTRIELPEGTFRVRIVPRPDGTGYDLVDTLLQGDVTVT